MTLFEEICKDSLVINEGVSNTKINKAISGMHPVTITYDDQKGGNGKGPRVIYPVAYGLTSSDNPVIRAYQPSGDTKRGVPKWKYFRVDRIKSWNIDMKTKYDGESLEGFMSGGNSKTGDDSMSVVYNIAPIGNARYIHRINKLKPKNFSNEKEIEIDDKPITKQDVENIEVEETPAVEQPKKKYNIHQIINNLINRIKKPFIRQKQNNTIDNSVKNDNTDNSTMTAPDAKPITKDELPNSNNTEGSEEIPKNNDEPVTKQDIGNAQENELTKSYNDMMNRMNNLYKDEE